MTVEEGPFPIISVDGGEIRASISVVDGGIVREGQMAIRPIRS